MAFIYHREEEEGGMKMVIELTMAELGGIYLYCLITLKISS